MLWRGVSALWGLWSFKQRAPLVPGVLVGGIVTSLGERKLASFPESGKRIADGGPGGTLERWRPSMFYTRKQDQS